MANSRFLYILQKANFENDKDVFEQFMISILVMDDEEDVNHIMIKIY